MNKSNPFLTKAFKRLDQIDKASLAQWATLFKQERDQALDVIDSAREGLILIDSRLEARIINRAAQRILGIANPVHVSVSLEKALEDKNFLKWVRVSVNANNDIFDEAFELFQPRHQHITVDIQKCIQGVESHDSVSRSYLLSLRPETDTDRKTKEQHQNERVSSLLSLASGIAHEIGNPLNSINIHLRLISDRLKDLPKSSQASIGGSLATVIDETQRLDAIIRNFLKATRRKSLHFDMGSIETIINDLVDFLKPELTKSKIRVVINYTKNFPRFYIDVARITQVFMNLIKNAIQAMPKGGQLDISASRDKELALIRISDTGVGLNPESLSNIFNAYYTTKEEGSGLGLVIVYQILKEHGGRIEIASETGKGATIHVFLPIRKEKRSLPAPTKKGSQSEQFI